MVTNIPYPVIDMKKTGENIKRVREKNDISVRELQQYLGQESPQAIYQWQRGISLPTVDHLCALSHLFGITMNEISLCSHCRNKLHYGRDIEETLQILYDARKDLLASTGIYISFSELLRIYKKQPV